MTMIRMTMTITMMMMMLVMMVVMVMMMTIVMLATNYRTDDGDDEMATKTFLVPSAFHELK